MIKKLRVGIVAPSSKVPMIEFGMGVEKIREAGFEVTVHRQVRQGHLFFAGTDEARAEAFLEMAMNPDIDVIWCARGGYGSARLLPYLDRFTEKRGVPPRKLLVGFSDATALLEYTRTRWGWAGLHSAMPGLRKFCALKAEEWAAIQGWIGGEAPRLPFGRKALKFIGERPVKPIEGEMVGGNLSVWVSLIGTSFAGKAQGKIVFLEDVDEWLYRLDRMVNQLIDSGALEGAQAVVLGNFAGCHDSVPSVLAKKPSARSMDRMIHQPKPSELEPLRKRLRDDKTIREIFSAVESRLSIPVAYGLPCGHGPEKMPLPLGGRYRLGAEGRLEVLSWDWLAGK